MFFNDKRDKNADRLNLRTVFPPQDIDNEIDRLKQMTSTYKKKYELEIGMIAQWKENMKNSSIPLINQPFMILEIFPTPLNKSANSEPLDVKIGFYSEQHNAYLTSCVCSSRIKPLIKKN